MKTKLVRILTTYRVDFDNEDALDQAVFDIVMKQPDHLKTLGAGWEYTVSRNDSKLHSIKEPPKGKK